MLTRSLHKHALLASLRRTLDEQRQFVLPELGEVVSLEDDTFSRLLYHHVASESAIDDFLRKDRSYSLKQRRWRLPRSGTKFLDKDFYTPFFNVLTSILAHFWNEPTVRGTRKVVDTHATGLPHYELDRESARHWSHPTFVIRAEGPSFQLPITQAEETPTDTGFSNVTACIDVHTQDHTPVSEELTRAAIYARQIFIQQPNRRFVRLVFISGDHFRLFHFDRSGVQYTPYINFHLDPHILVRIILGLSSPDESDIGLDYTIQWTIVNGRKVGGTLTTNGNDGLEVVYTLQKVAPLFFRGHVCGRATICWSVRDPVTGEDLVVKDSWKSEERVSEHVYLREAVGIPGVVQMVSCEPNRDETRNLRQFGSATPKGFQNRVETRVVMKAYGKSIACFTSAMQVFCALRDAIAGHMEMYKKGILHRDISLNNVLLGKPGAKPGSRGALIDFDAATHLGAETLEDWIIGTRLYQSIAVLTSSEYDDPLLRDHLDDLESFLYVLVHIMFGYNSQGVFQSFPEIMQLWPAETPRFVASVKGGLLTWKRPPVPVEKLWPIPCINLLLAYQEFILRFVYTKRDLSRRTREARREEAELLASNANQHYTHILKLFDEAIAQLDAPEDTWELCYETYSDCSLISESSSDSERSSGPQKVISFKRAAEECPTDQPPAKRS
ncbi:hypothetical protein MD484_g793, partial [Candolleomyces efflorescens]